MPKCDFNKDFTSAWVFSCRLAAYFQNTFFKNTSGRLLLNSTNFIKWEILILILTIHEQNMIS